MAYPDDFAAANRAARIDAQHADDTTNPENRMLLVAMARAWLKLAQRSEQSSSADNLSQPHHAPIEAADP